MSCPGSTLGDAYAAGWAQRVIDNGGARPAQTTVDAAATFYNALVSANLLSKMKAVNFIAPDSLIAAQTPFIRRYGSDPWTNTAFVAADLTVNGLNNPLTSKLNSGCNPSTMFASDNSGGATVYTSTGQVGDRCFVYCINGANYFGIYQQGGTLRGTIWDQVGAGGEAGGAALHIGYISINRTAANDLRLYVASGTVPHAQAASNLNAVTGSRPNETIPTHQYKLGAGEGYYFVGKISFVAFHDGLTAAESLSFYNAIQALRVSLGGGFIPDPSDAEEMSLSWAARVVANGGAMPSAATISAAEDFYQDLIDAGIHTKMYSLNFMAPDSIIAASTPLIKTAGFDPWTNVNFVAGDLTVNGLKGNASNKRLLTGVAPGTFAATTNWGITAYVSQYVAESATTLIGHYQSTTEGSLLALADNLAKFMSNRWTTNTLFGAATTAGYYSANRTAVDALAIYHAKAATAHGAIASDTFAPVGGFHGSDQMYVFSETYGAYTAQRLSLAALHQGLTESQSSAFYNAIQSLRTALGGGYV